MSVSGSRFRTVTILHAEEDTPWCNYLLKHFKSDQMKLRIETLNVSSFEYQNPAEIEVAVRESYAVLLLTTSYMLDYLERNQHWLLATLNKRDLAVTSLIAATLNISTLELQEARQNFQTDISWQVLQVDVDGSNIKSCIAEILQITDINFATHLRQTAAEAKEKDLPSVFPSVVHKTGEQVVLIFPTAKEKGSVTLYLEDTIIPVETLNPFCVTFKAPDIHGPHIRLTVMVHGNKVGRVKLGSLMPPHFTSVELMCQTCGASSKEELDTMLAETFTSSFYDDPSLTFLFSNLSSKVQSGKQDSQYPTLLHWTAANGLRELCSVLLTASGSNQACAILNCDGRTPADLAEESGYRDLSEYILDFNEMRNVADACDLYIQSSHKQPSAEVSIYQDMSPRLNPEPPPVPPKPTTAPPKTQPPPFFDTSRADDGDTYEVPDHIYKVAGMSRSQIELIEIQEEFKNKKFTIKEAEMLFNAWKLRYGSGNAISFKEKQQKLQILREEHKKAMDLHKAAKNKKHKAKKEDKLPKKKTSASSQELNISDPIGMRKCMTLPSMLPSREGESLRDRLSNDSGHSSVHSSGSMRAGSYLSNSSERGSCLSNVSMRSSTMSHTSTSSEESEYQGHRKSTYEQYLGLTDDPSDQPTSDPPPPLPPRRKIALDSKASFSSSQPRPVVYNKPQPPPPARKPSGSKK